MEACRSLLRPLGWSALSHHIGGQLASSKYAEPDHIQFSIISTVPFWTVSIGVHSTCSPTSTIVSNRLCVTQLMPTYLRHLLHEQTTSPSLNDLYSTQRSKPIRRNVSVAESPAGRALAPPASLRQSRLPFLPTQSTHRRDRLSQQYRVNAAHSDPLPLAFIEQGVARGSEAYRLGLNVGKVRLLLPQDEIQYANTVSQ